MERDFVADTSTYTDFSGYNEIARSDRMFIDAWHMEPAVGAVIMRQLLGLGPARLRRRHDRLELGAADDCAQRRAMLALPAAADGRGDRHAQHLLDHRRGGNRQALWRQPGQSVAVASR